MINGANRVFKLNKLSELGQNLVEHIIGANRNEPWEIVEATGEYLISSVKCRAEGGKSYVCYKIDFCVDDVNLK